MLHGTIRNDDLKHNTFETMSQQRWHAKIVSCNIT